MKRISLLVFLLLFLVSCKQESETTGTESPADTQEESVQKTEEKKELTTIEFYEESHDFGEISEGEKVSHRFKFKNTGKYPLIIEDVKPSCGCTTPNYSKDPVPPGEEGFIDVEFNSQGRSGKQTKSITIKANTEKGVHVLRFTGEVIKK